MYFKYPGKSSINRRDLVFLLFLDEDFLWPLTFCPCWQAAGVSVHNTTRHKTTQHKTTCSSNKNCVHSNTCQLNILVFQIVLHGFAAWNPVRLWMCRLQCCPTIRRVHSHSILFCVDCVFLQVLSVSRNITFQGFLPATHLMTSGRVSINKKKKEIPFLIFFFPSRYLWDLSQRLKRPEELPLLKHIFITIYTHFHFQISVQFSASY